eukprot:SAG11_NODE_29_length_23137_cov_16.739995_8_plen_103_part_00
MREWILSGCAAGQDPLPRYETYDDWDREHCETIRAQAAAIPNGRRAALADRNSTVGISSCVSDKIDSHGSDDGSDADFAFDSDDLDSDDGWEPMAMKKQRQL